MFWYEMYIFLYVQRKWNLNNISRGTKIRTFSEKIRTIRTFLGEKSVQSVHFFFEKILTIRTIFLKKSVQSVQFLKKILTNRTFNLSQEINCTYQCFEIFSCYQKLINNNKTIMPKKTFYNHPFTWMKIHVYLLQLQEI